MHLGWVLMETASDAFSQGAPAKKITPRYYAWICLGFALFILLGIAGSIYTVLRRNIGSIQRRWYSWCLFCDKRSRDMNLRELGPRKSYDTFATSFDPSKKDYVIGMYNGSDLPSEWTPLPGGLKRSGISCPNIKFDSSVRFDAVFFLSSRFIKTRKHISQTTQPLFPCSLSLSLLPTVWPCGA
uniref:Uncharacterized protein n=1 Tax=Lotharella oceanica TaxID=641309 RepID=A0A7S2TV66_9EUKA|mmetsp:Transcript_29042/g.54347  ORF Transcript_29042/g.54347 Transcript_29042/m.54347 type:complete len:184 (+) Transcript_29042:117-668(+)